MLLKISIFCLLWCAITVECAIFSMNNKYSSKQRLNSVKIDNGKIELGHRPKRSATTSAPRTTPPTPTRITTAAQTSQSKPTSSSGTESDIKIEPSVLLGSQRSNQAFIHWIGKGTSERIIILTCTLNISDGSRVVVESQLWRSNDYGSSFEEKTLDKNAKISYFYTFAQNEKKLLFTDVTAKKVYTTVDELETWKVITVPVEPDIVLPHPTDDNKILLYSLNQRKLYVSVDFAQNWTLLLDNVLPNFFWGVKGIDSNVDIVHMEIETEMSTQAYYKTCIVPNCNNATIDQVGPFLADSLFVHKEYMFVQKSSVLESDSYLMVSYKRAKFQRAFFPGDLKTDNFMLLNLDDGQVFIAVSHGDYVNLYLSDVTGQYYVLSFINIYHIMRLDTFEIDFHEVQGMNWTFLANKLEKEGVKTYISFDRGGNWAPLKSNNSCPANEDCSLLLEVKQSALMASMLSQENAPGIILAHGNNLHTAETVVFTSSDGGATWIKALLPDGTPLVGRFRFNILDQGGILTAVPDGFLPGNSSNTVYYSCDEGKQWKKQQLNSTLFVKGVLTEPGSLTMVESVFGHEGPNKPWTVVKLNFTKALEVKCDEQRDYYNWNPRDYNNVKSPDNCILGRVVMYKRRIPDHKCYNGEQVIIRANSSANCSCTSEDYECDFGYEEGNGGCQPAKWFNGTYFPPECDNSTSYNKSKGYRKIPADVCVENDADKEKYGKTLSACPLAAPSKLSILLLATKLPSGKEVPFHLEQAGGSKLNTTYTWNFGDGSKPEQEIGFENASLKKHIFRNAGHYNVSVIAQNTAGRVESKQVQVHVQDQLGNVYLVAPTAGKTGVPVVFSAYPTTSSRFVDTNSDHVHFTWTFGDESTNSLPLLVWNSSVTHEFKQQGTYRMSVEAVNSVSSFYKEQSIQIFDDAEILVLTFSNNADRYSSALPELLKLRIKQQLAEDLGVSMLCLEVVIVSTAPTTVHLFILPVPGEQTVTKIRDTVISLVKNGVLGVNFFGKVSEAGDIIQIASATEISSSPDHTTGPNMRAVYIAVPVLVLVVIVSILSFLYCRKKLHNIRQYNILHTQDDSDALLDDDEAPLDLNVDFGARESSRDDNILDAGGSHLVLVTGGGASDNAENC